MEDKSVFNRLISGLSQNERLEMLNKIHTIAPLNDLPLKNDYSEEEYDYEKSYQLFSVLEKIFIFFIVLFSTKEKDKAIENLSMDKLARQLEKDSPGLINYSSKKYLNKFLLEIEKLQNSLDIFTNTLPVILNSNESDFIAFLVGLHFPEVESKLLQSIDPKEAASDFEFENSFQLKRHIEFRIDEILGEIDSDKKKIIYKEIKNLHVLNALTVYNFENIISAFGLDEKGETYSCNFLEIRKALHNLLDILFSLNVSPSTDTLNAVFMFAEEIKNPYESTELEKTLKQNMEDAKIAFESIRKFNSNIPLESILCLVNRNMNFHPAHIGGAEDWYALFRRFWYKKFDLLMEKFAEEEKKIQLEEDAAFFLNIQGKAYLQNYRDGLWGKNSRVKFQGTAGFIKIFMTVVFPKELIRPLKLVLIDGQFYKEQNRLDYNSSYSTLIDVVDLIKKLDASLSADGEYLSQIEKMKLEQDEDREDFINDTKNYIDKEFGKIITNFNQALGLLIDVISGIVQGEMGGKYDTLSNLGYIGKGENKNLIAQLNDIRFKLDEARSISHQMYDLENGQKK
ncbi:MAG: hypothetical protein DRP58_11445 [Spirochaetes bacterium]|nr:MAG: hypothetical protein DRP58_11445 [Spirochaetota bacterium]